MQGSRLELNHRFNDATPWIILISRQYQSERIFYSKVIETFMSYICISEETCIGGLTEHYVRPQNVCNPGLLENSFRDWREGLYQHLFKAVVTSGANISAVSCGYLCVQMTASNLPIQKHGSWLPSEPLLKLLLTPEFVLQWAFPRVLVLSPSRLL